MTFAYGSESPFWYFLAHRARSGAEAEISGLFTVLNHRAENLGLPVVFQAPHALAWAIICRLFNDTQSRATSLDKMAFTVMKLGFGHLFGPKEFVETAFHRILGNIQAPAFVGRSRDESVVDSFLANGLKLVDERSIDPARDAQIIEACLSDGEMHALGQRACRPSPTLWNDTVREYSGRRPAWLVRQFTDPNKWLFD